MSTMLFVAGIREQHGRMASFTLQWNGTGAAINAELGQTSFTISGEGDNGLLVDCGGTVPGRLQQLGELDRITDVLITHMHADHIGGLESLAYHAYYVQQRMEEGQLRLHLATEAFRERLWEHCLKGAMEHAVDFSLEPAIAGLDTYFDVHVGTTVQVQGIPEVCLFPAVHVGTLENYGLRIGDRVYYSGDTIETPTSLDFELIFHDHQFRAVTEPGVHVAYQELLDAIPREDRKRVHLVHSGLAVDPEEPVRDGFAGIVLPGQKFVVR